MKTILFILVQVILAKSASGQFKKQSSGYSKTETGFLFFRNETPKNIAFVPSRYSKDSLFLDDFKTDQLQNAFEINWEQIFVDTLKSRRFEVQLKNVPSNDLTVLSIIPVLLTYKINPYKKTNKQFKESVSFEYFEFNNRLVKIKIIGAIPVNVITVTAL